MIRNVVWCWVFFFACLQMGEGSSHKPSKTSKPMKPYWVEKGQFYTQEGLVPPGCFGQLITELNGDDVVASVFLNRTSFRGCIRANIPYTSEKVFYRIIEAQKEDRWLVKVCHPVDGTMREFCQQLLLRFYERDYLYQGKVKKVLAVEKLGEVEPKPDPKPKAKK